jgi:hypothetical protein
MGGGLSNTICVPSTTLVGDPGQTDSSNQSVMYRQGTYMPSNNKSGKYKATVVVASRYVLFTLKFPPYVLPATVYGKASDLLNPNHRCVLNSEVLGGAYGKYKFDRVMYFNGNKLVFSSTQKKVATDSGKTLISNANWVLEKVYV